MQAAKLMSFRGWPQCSGRYPPCAARRCQVGGHSAPKGPRGIHESGTGQARVTHVLLSSSDLTWRTLHLHPSRSLELLTSRWGGVGRQVKCCKYNICRICGLAMPCHRFDFGAVRYCKTDWMMRACLFKVTSKYISPCKSCA